MKSVVLKKVNREAKYPKITPILLKQNFIEYRIDQQELHIVVIADTVWYLCLSK